MISVVHRPDKAPALAPPCLSRLWLGLGLRRNRRQAGAFRALSDVLGVLSARSLAAGARPEHAPVRLRVLPLGWGLTVFAANSAPCKRLPTNLQQQLRRELAQWEARIWREAGQDTTAALPCAHGKHGLCDDLQRQDRTLAPLAAHERQRRHESFLQTVLPRRLLRCSIDCASLWRKTLGRLRSIAFPTLP